MFAVKTEGSDDLKAIISAISTLVDEATFVANADGITFRGMDPSHVALIDITWPSSAFAAYKCDDDIKFGVRIDELSKLIKRAGKKDDISISITDDSSLQVRIGKQKTYKMRLIQSSATSTPLPKVPHDIRIDVPQGAFDRMLGDVQVVSNYLTIEAAESRVVFSGRGDSGEVTIEMDTTNADQITGLEVKKDGSGSYSLEYLNPIVKAVGSAAETATCEYSNAKPLRIEFKVSNIGIIHFYLAPRVDSQ